jgi:hypothetical protein
MRYSAFSAAVIAWCVLLIPSVCLPAVAGASTPQAGWALSARNYPTSMDPGSHGTMKIDVSNVGAVASNGTITVTDTLPRDVTATNAGELHPRSSEDPEHPGIGHELWACTIATGPDANSVVSCTNTSELPGLAGGGGHPNLASKPLLQPQIGIAISVSPGAAAGVGVNRVVIAGGGALSSGSTTNPVVIAAASASFRVAGWDGWFSNADGTLDSQAGSHPYAFTTVLDFPTVLKEGEAGEKFLLNAGGEPRNLVVNLPPGLVGNPRAVPQCTRQQLNALKCPNASQIGNLTVEFAQASFVTVRVFNLVPPPGVAAEFGGTLENLNTFLDSGVRTGGDYGITTHVENLAQKGVVSSFLTLWGVPADPSHIPWRTTDQGGCSPEKIQENNASECSQPPGLAERPFLTLPSSCSGPQSISLSANTWQAPTLVEPTSFVTHDSNGNESGITGCSRLDFSPTIKLTPESSVTDSPTGLHVDLHIPQSEEDPEGVAEADLKNAVVTLPAGMTVNPSQANGLQACSSTEIGLHGPDVANCPNAAKIGTVAVDTPLLDHPLSGSVYLAAQGDNPFNSLLAIYIAINDPKTGIVVKLAGHIEADPATGQLTTRFDETPQLPFEDFKLDFFGGPHAPLATPSSCGNYTTVTQLTPWSAPEGADASPPSGFAIDEGCATGFAPSFTAGTINNQAAGFSPFSVTFSRQDSDHTLSGVSITTPPGLLGALKTVVQCPDPQASRGSCGPESLIGEATAAAGVGSDPFWVKGGRVYLTRAYNGGPFGLSIVVPAVAGPFNLGNVVVRSSVRVDPHTAQIVVVSDPLPQMVNSIEGLQSGIPTDLRTVNVTINRPGFMFNPTNCAASKVSGTITSSHGAVAGVSSPFQAANCAVLPFKPGFTVSTQGKTSKANGASLNVKVAQKPGEANIHKVDVSLPLALPSRLTTLQKACTEAQFNRNPAGCPVGSNVGTATAHTPILSSPLTGPAYLVSHGGAAFPDLVIILQGEGITIVLTGNTDIKKGITFSRFDTVPDAPISSFELNLPESSHSALAANVNLCAPTASVQVRKRFSVRRHGHTVHVLRSITKLVAAPLTMPTAITGQNGAVMQQSTKISVTGCSKAKAKRKSRAKNKTKRGSKRRGARKPKQ